MTFISAKEAEALVTWRCAVTTSALAVLLAAFGPSLGLLNLAATSRPFIISRATVILSALGLLGLLVAQRKHPRLWVMRTAFVLPAAPVLLMYSFVDLERTAQGLPVELFTRPLAASVAFAILTPPRAFMSLIAVAAFSVENQRLYRAAHRWNLWQIHGCAFRKFRGLFSGNSAVSRNVVIVES
jgi:hypothetical protein